MEPWSIIKTDKKRMNTIIYIALEQIAKISILLNPIIPNATEKVLKAMNIPRDLWNLSFIKTNKIFKKDITLNKLDILFKKFGK